LDRHERQPGEQAPLGIILCAGSKRETVEYLRLDEHGIHVAEYLTELPLREVLREQLHRATALARERLALRAGMDAAPPAVAPRPQQPSAGRRTPRHRARPSAR
jgi:hypothetical protein